MIVSGTSVMGGIVTEVLVDVYILGVCGVNAYGEQIQRGVLRRALAEWQTVEHLHGRVWNNLFDFC